MKGILTHSQSASRASRPSSLTFRKSSHDWPLEQIPRFVFARVIHGHPVFLQKLSHLILWRTTSRLVLATENKHQPAHKFPIYRANFLGAGYGFHRLGKCIQFLALTFHGTKGKPLPKLISAIFIVPCLDDHGLTPPTLFSENPRQHLLIRNLDSLLPPQNLSYKGVMGLRPLPQKPLPGPAYLPIQGNVVSVKTGSIL